MISNHLFFGMTMCGRFALIDKPETIQKLFNVELRREYEPSFNVAPSQVGLVIAGKDRLAEPMQWGFLPFWASDKKLTTQINAKCETVHEKPMFRDAFKRHRCAIAISGFYEWDRQEQDGKVIKVPHYFYLKNKQPFLLAGIWDRYEIDDKEHTGFAILTTKPNKLLGKIHTRMPVIIKPAMLDNWLNKDSEPDAFSKMFAPFPATNMNGHIVTSKMNNPRFNNASCIEKI